MTVVDEFAGALSGQAFWRGDPGYDAAAAGFNAAVQHEPAVVVCATNADDVVAAVRYAAGAGLPISVQATGHGAHHAVTDGVLISTARLTDVHIDPQARTATVGPGAKWRAVLDAAAEYGLAGLCGSTSDVGVVGYTLGGGMPVLGRMYGFAAERVRSFEVVTADGVLRKVDAEHEPELFWALRGGGGNVGIVTSMTFELLPIETVYGGGIFYPGGEAATVLRAYAEWVKTVPQQMCSSVAFLRLPPLPEIPEPLRGQFVMHVRIAYTGPADEGERLLAPLRACAPVMIDMVGEMPYRELDRIHMDPEHPVPFAERGSLLRDLGEDTVSMLLDQAGPDTESPLLMVEVRHLGGAFAREHDDAIGARGARFSLFSVGVLAGPAAAAVPGALDALDAAAAPYGTGRTFLSFHGAPGDAADRARAWTPEQYTRLQRLKGSYDRHNLFRFGHAITPA